MEWNFVFVFNSVLLGVGLAMDAFSVSMANGLNEPAMKQKKMCGVAGVFAFFQALTYFIVLAIMYLAFLTRNNKLPESMYNCCIMLLYPVLTTKIQIQKSHYALHTD